MPATALRLLIVDDDDGDRKQIIRCIRKSQLDCEFVEVATMQDALAAVEASRFDCAILDYYLPGQMDLDGIPMLLDQEPMLPIIVSTGQGNEQIASEAIKRGALDYISKSELTPLTLRNAIDHALQRADLNRALAEQQRALVVFARVLVHDLKAPMQSILGFARLIEVFMRNEKFDRDKIAAQARRIAEGALRMNALLDQLHAYTEADAAPQFDNIMLDQLVCDVVTNLDAPLRQRGAHVVYGGLPNVCGDRAQLIQLLQNLIGNGIKYCRAETPEVHIEAETQPNGTCVVEVRDNGIGIPEKNFKDVFEPFRRLHSQGEFEGTGLGLATCKKIVERHGGSIWCRSKPGEGTSFFFTIPALCAAEDRPAVVNG
jgi:signal transduction histidine kinase